MADDLTGWLRRVRPPTSADAGWVRTDAADEVLAAVHERTARRGAHPRRRWLPASGLVAAAAVAVIVLALDGTGGGPGGPGTPAGPGPVPHEFAGARPAALLLSDYSSCSGLLHGLRAHTAAHVTRYGLPGAEHPLFRLGTAVPYGAEVNAPTIVNAAGLAQSAALPGQSSTTNDQVAGVDEPDIMKTDGGRVVTVTDGVLRVTDAASDTVIGSLDLTLYDGWQNAELFASGEHALVLLGADSSMVSPYRTGPILSGGTTARAHTTALFVDLAGAPTVTGSLRADGGYLAARLVGSTVRLVVASTPTLNFPVTGKPSKARNQRVVRQAPLSAWLPSYTVTDGSASSRHQVPCRSVSHPADYTGTSLITVYTLALGAPDGGAAPVSVVADGDTVYATADSLYVASNPNWWVSDRKAQQTEVHRFDIADGGAPVYLGSGTVPGRLLSQYSLSDYDGYLRVATTAVGRNRSNGVYVLDAATLTVAGHVRGLGHGEQLRAVRFVGPLAYVVTFRQVDPLYVVDLSDPARPRLAGSLRLTGYSTYLHDAGDGRLIGVGEQVGARNEPTGLQVSLYDVSDPSAPRRTANVVRAGTAGEGQLDPHAFLYWRPSGLVVVPVQAWKPSASGAALVLRLHGRALHTVGTVRNPVGSAVPDDGQGIRRSMLVDGNLWTLSGSGLQVLDPDTLTRRAWIAFS